MGGGRFPGRSAFSAHARSDLLEASCGSPIGTSVSNSKAVRARGFPASALEQNACPLKPGAAAPGKATPKAKSARPSGRRSGKPAPPEIDEHDLLLAVESLYQDQLRPYGRLLRKRLSERGVATGLDSGEAGLEHLRKQCLKSAWLSLEAAQGGEWVVLLLGCKPDFVDFYSPKDQYPESLWSALEAYLERITGEDAVMPSGRFSCAQCLLDRRLPFLHGYSLGSLCHIVQLMISQKKLLGYSSEGIVPYARSQSMLKEKAAQRRSCEDTSDLPFATWTVVRRSMLEALQGDDGLPAPLPLSNIKRMFRTRFNTELCETALGHSKLSELLQDPCLDGICTVKLLEQGYFVLPLFDKVASEDETEAGSTSMSSSEARLFPQGVDWTVRNTFVEVSPAKEVLRRTKSLTELETSLCFLEPACQAEACESCQSLPAAFDTFGFEIHNTFIVERSQASGAGLARSRSARRA